MADARRLVYVVDDEATIAHTLALILEQNGYEAVPFTQPIEALRAAESRRPQFLITDVSMPLLNGIELSIQFKETFPECKILLFSGAMSTSSLLAEAQQRGHDFTILAKPVPPRELLEKLKGMVDS